MRSTIHGLRIAVVALAGYWTLLFISTHIPAQGIMQRVRANDKVLHVIAFSGLAFLIAWAIPTNKNRLSQNVVIAAAVGVIYGGIDELL
ncbi:MAG: VanZ family protein, partial [Pirellula sp.]